ncbi:MAG: TraR/DksA C4-type zinc finger protein [Candidatus Omnitrophota bacterium]
MRKLVKKELAKYKEKLIKLREGVSQELQSLGKDSIGLSQRDAAGDLSGYTYHMADVATDNYERDLSGNLATTGQKALYDIDAAIEKINNNTYGKCEVCNVDISKQRLNALPYAKLCKKCQQQQENKNSFPKAAA